MLFHFLGNHFINIIFFNDLDPIYNHWNQFIDIQKQLLLGSSSNVSGKFPLKFFSLAILSSLLAWFFFS